MMYVWLLIGFVLLVKGADFFVEGSSSVAKLLRIPSIVIGLTIVAFGTSAPEAAVSITAAISHQNDIAVGNVVGSNIFNLLMVLGCCAVVLPTVIDKKLLLKDYPFSLLITAVLLVLVAFDLHISRLDGILLLGFFAYFLFRTVHHALQERTSAGEDDTIKVRNPFVSAVYILGGMAAIVAGGDLVVDSASAIASTFGLSQNLIGLTIVAMGTSLPELVTSIVAAKKGETGLALGNVVGSNIFNILFVLASSAAISPISVQMASVYDLILLLVFSVITWLFCRSKYEVNRLEGASMVLMYAAYMVYIILR